jgi:hypothetical protein
VLAVEWSERQLPSLFALEIISDQAEIGEEDKNTLSIGHRSRRRAVIEFVLVFAFRSADGSLPLNLAGGAAQTDRNQIITLGSGKENAIPNQDGGGFPWRQLCLPQNIFFRTKLGWQFPA